MCTLKVEDLAPGVRQLLFNRPEKLNALSTHMIEALDGALDDAKSDPDVRVVVLRGAGGKAFVGGADIAEYQGDKREAFIAYQLTSRGVFDKLETIGKPTICAIDGYALGGGFELALCCDIIIVSETAQLGLPEAKLGLCPGGGGTQRLVRALGKHVASDVLLAGWRLSAERAYALGLAAEIVPSERLSDAVFQRARGCLKMGPLAQAEIKRLVRQGGDCALESAKSFEQEVLFRLYSTQDGQEGISAFLEKRDPQFKGT